MVQGNVSPEDGEAILSIILVAVLPLMIDGISAVKIVMNTSI